MIGLEALMSRTPPGPRPSLPVVPPRRLRDIRTLGAIRSLPPRGPVRPGSPPLRAWLFRGDPSGVGLARQPERMVVDREIQPEVALEKDAGGLWLLAEVAGVTRSDDIQVTLHGDVLCIESGPPCRYYRELLLPYPARLVHKGLRDGLLELHLCPEEPTT